MPTSSQRSVLALAVLCMSSGPALASSESETETEAERECLIQASFSHEADRQYASKLAIETIDEGPVLRPTMRVRCSKIEEIAGFAQSYNVIDKDLQATIAAERERMRTWNAQYSVRATSPKQRYKEYLNLKQFRSVVDSWVKAFPDYVQLETIGKSVQGRPIRAVHISRFKGDKAPKHRTIILGGHHSREWLAHATTLCITERFIRGIDKANSRHRKILSNMTLSVIPMGNPDGFVATHESNRMQRKNANGVDLNRNWDIAWGTEGEANVPKEAENYPGSAAWSEPETAAYRDFIKKYSKGLKGFFDIHAFIPAIMVPYGYKYGKHPKAAEYKDIMRAMSAAMTGPGMQRYEMGPLNEIVGLASGSSVDWVDAATGAFSFGTEVRGTSFVMPASEIKPSCDENEAALLAFFEKIIPMDHDPDDSGNQDGNTDGGGNQDDSSNGTATAGGQDTSGSSGNQDGNNDGNDDNTDGNQDPSNNDKPNPKKKKGGCRFDSGDRSPFLALVLLGGLHGFRRRRRPNPR